MRSTRSTRPSVKVSRSEIRRAVASSTAIETGQSVKSLERRLKSGANRRRQVALAAARTR